eukprot:CAMPEP_0179123084 /NCGR_PEP_ID=MMETSP0796-20121207/58117_1 /TAXON_ID=73915 /ORGANISM="Pyrodinium bahamense, Strain pbaha01" /LENGTH=137 /DNA_ID=CAMNT_0020821723 /DNA_START=80 /DNA_END=493 /DNA_ORIENTATION=-
MATTVDMSVTVPEGATPGATQLIVTSHEGNEFVVTVPAGVNPGDSFMVQYECAAPPDVPAGEPISTGGMILGADDTKEYFAFKPAAYQVGQNVMVPRSSGEYSPAVIHTVYLTALGPMYEVDVGGATKNVPEDEIHV